MEWYLINKVLPMGCLLSCSLFLHVLHLSTEYKSGLKDIGHYLDDFYLVV